MIFLSILHQNSDISRRILNRWAATIPAELALPRRVARALLYETLATEANLPKESYRLAYDTSGRPSLESAADRRLPAISLSHSNGWIACAALTDGTPGQQGSIGIDLEVAKARRDHLELAEAAFGPREIAAVRGQGDAAFYRIWTLREAWSKATGEGFAGVTDRNDHVPDGLLDEDCPAVATGPDTTWWSTRLLPDLHLALVYSRPPAASQLDDKENRSTPALWRCHVSPELDLSGLSFANGNPPLSRQGNSGSADAAT